MENSTGEVLKTTVNVSRLKMFTPNPMNTEQVGDIMKNALFYKKVMKKIVTRTSKKENQPKKVRS